MRPDFFVKQRETPDGMLQVFIPANSAALIWMLARTEEHERGQVSGQFTSERAEEVRKEAKHYGFRFSDEMMAEAKTA